MRSQFKPTNLFFFLIILRLIFSGVFRGGDTFPSFGATTQKKTVSSSAFLKFLKQWANLPRFLNAQKLKVINQGFCRLLLLDQSLPCQILSTLLRGPQIFLPHDAFDEASCGVLLSLNIISLSSYALPSGVHLSLTVFKPCLSDVTSD